MVHFPLVSVSLPPGLIHPASLAQVQWHPCPHSILEVLVIVVWASGLFSE